mgnify:CR=1 FL=1
MKRIFAAFLLLFGLAGCAGQQASYTTDFFAMDTFMSVSVYGDKQDDAEQTAVACEQAVNALAKPQKKKPVKKQKNPNEAKVEEELKEILGTRVHIQQSGKKGRIEIEFFGRDELERLIDLLKSL